MNQGVSHIAKQIILEELSENAHIEPVEDVIFWALQHYANNVKGTAGAMVAHCIVKRIEEEIEFQKKNN